MSMVALLASCGSDSGGGGGGNSLAGTVLGPAGTGLPGVVVEVSSPERTAQATTDANGNFIVLKPPTGLVDLHVDGTGAPGGIFPALELSLMVGGGASNLSQPIVLPDLSAGTTVAVAVDGNGQTTGMTTVIAPDGSQLDIADMTTILVDGGVPAGSVDINVTPVPAINVPMPLPGNQDPGAFVTIQPPGASFDPALDITLPNTRNFPPGTMVDIWSFDHQEGAWVNRSEETGNQGTVSVDGLFIVAMGVITEGGWHSGTIPVDPECATTIEGRVFAEGETDTLDDVLISLSTGQFAVTDGDGRFSISLVPAYDASMLPGVCVASDVELRAIAPVAFGSMTVTMTISSKDIVTGGTTDIGDFDIPVSFNGSLVGSVLQDGEGVEGTVSITGADEASAESDENGSFFVAALEEGEYTASFDFTTGTVSKDFKITANKTTVVTLKGSGSGGGGGGGGDIDVRVLDFSAQDNGSGVPVDDACVTLQGASGAPLFQTTGKSGVASFSDVPDGPYTVTAQKDITLAFGNGRLATTLVDVEASGSPGVISIPFFSSEFLNPAMTDAILEGTILNDPGGVTFEFQVVSSPTVGFESSATNVGTSFMPQVPSGVPLDIAVLARDMVSGDVVSGVFKTGLMVDSGMTLMEDFDFADAVAFDQPVTITYNNLQAAHTNFNADLDLRATGILDTSFLVDGTTLPDMVDWPEVSSTALAPFDGFFDVGTEAFGGTFEGSFCELPLGTSTPSSITVDFLGTPTIQQPENNGEFPTYGPGDVVDFTLGSGNGSTAGFNSVIFTGETANLFTFWEIMVPPGTTSVTIPPVFANKPMFPDGFYGASVAAVRFDFSGFDFATFFDENLATNIAAVNASEVCDAERAHFFIVGTPPTAPDEGAQLRLVRRAPLASAR